MKNVLVVVLVLFGGIGCVHAPPAPPKPVPVLAPVGADMYKVQFLGVPYADSELWVCGRGDVAGIPELGLSCIPYEMFMKELAGQL